MESKKLRLMRHIIESEGYDDHALADDMACGFPLVGEVPQSHVLPRKLLPATMSRQGLRSNSKRSNDALRYMTRSCGDKELDKRLWDKTMLEVERGWLLGPLPWDSLKEDSTLSRRFPLEQAGKIRPIDDLSQSQINSTSALGVQFDLNATCDGVLKVCNTEKRIRETLELLDGVMARGTLQKREALVLRGRLAFCDAFIFGRLGKIALQDITKHAYANPFAEQLNPSTLDSMRLLRSRIADGKPRRLTCELLETLYLFTDASFDTDHHAGLGAVLVDGTGKIIAWFGLSLDHAQLALFLADGQQTIIGEFETLAVALALLIWQNLLESVQLMVYIDNEGSKFSLIKGYSTSRAITAVCALAATTLDAYFVLPWFARVPSISNLADYTSRQLEHPLLVKDTMVHDEEVRRCFLESLAFLKMAFSPP